MTQTDILLAGEILLINTSRRLKCKWTLEDSGRLVQHLAESKFVNAKLHYFFMKSYHVLSSFLQKSLMNGGITVIITSFWTR